MCGSVARLQSVEIARNQMIELGGSVAVRWLLVACLSSSHAAGVCTPYSSRVCCYVLFSRGSLPPSCTVLCAGMHASVVD